MRLAARHLPRAPSGSVQQQRPHRWPSKRMTGRVRGFSGYYLVISETPIPKPAADQLISYARSTDVDLTVDGRHPVTGHV